MSHPVSGLRVRFGIRKTALFNVGHEGQGCLVLLTWRVNSRGIWSIGPTPLSRQLLLPGCQIIWVEEPRVFNV